MKTTSSEHDEQAALFEWAAVHERKYPELALMFAVPNGGKRAAITGARLRDEGVKPGVPDIFLPVARSGYHGLFIEMKAGRNAVGKEQMMWLERLGKEGYCLSVRWRWEQAAQDIKWYLTGCGESRPA